MIHFSADTSKAVKKIMDASVTLYDFILKEAEKQLNAYVKELQSYIEDQKGNWAPLTAAYLERKVKQGLDPRTLIATGDYIKSFKVKREGTKFLVYPEGNEDLGQWLEFGTSKMPARPHWTHIDIQIRYTMSNILLQLAKRKCREEYR